MAAKFKVGQTIEYKGKRYEVVKLAPTTAVLRDSDGALLWRTFKVLAREGRAAARP